jgi:hypothetical protein
LYFVHTVTKKVVGVFIAFFRAPLQEGKYINQTQVLVIFRFTTSYSTGNDRYIASTLYVSRYSK